MTMSNETFSVEQPKPKRGRPKADPKVEVEKVEEKTEEDSD